MPRVQGVRDSGRVVTVYNLRVADFHTYFVGSRDWSWSVWTSYSAITHLTGRWALLI